MDLLEKDETKTKRYKLFTCAALQITSFKEHLLPCQADKHFPFREDNSHISEHYNKKNNLKAKSKERYLYQYISDKI